MNTEKPYSTPLPGTCATRQSGCRRRFRTDSVRLWILSFATFALLAACSEIKEEAIPPGSQVLALGDSLTEGVGVTREEAWPNLLAGRTGWVVTNGGESGDTSGGALRRLPSLLEQHAPVLVLVTLGGNDMLRHIPQQETIANLEKIIALIREHGAKPVLLATPQPSIAGAVFQNLSAPDFYRAVAKQQQVPLIEDAIAEILSDPQLKVDQLHPNAAGHTLLTGNIYEELKAIGYVR
ncbi:MAG: arylesterase [Nitrosomonadales bacterium]|nr:arylesterase [Nitrosomonadales bacterium]